MSEILDYDPTADAPLKNDINHLNDANLRQSLPMPERVAAIDSSKQVNVYIRKPEWMREAACKGKTEYFFSSGYETKIDKAAREAIARSICAECVVYEDCEDFAYRKSEGLLTGILAGKNEDEWYEIRKRRRRAG